MALLETHDPSVGKKDKHEENRGRWRPLNNAGTEHTGSLGQQYRDIEMSAAEPHLSPSTFKAETIPLSPPASMASRVLDYGPKHACRLQPSTKG